MSTQLNNVFVEILALQEFCVNLLQKLSVPEEEARLIAETLIEADRRGVHTHGVVALSRYVGLLRSGAMQPAAVWRVERDKGPMAVWDGQRSNGQVLGCRAMDKAIEKAKIYGIGMVCVKNGNHNGAGAYYAQLAEKAGMIGLAMSTATPTMAPWGGAEKLVGNSPLAVAVPAGERPGIVLDMAQSVVAFGKIDSIKRQQKTTIPMGWALDRDGVETTEIEKVYSAMPVGAYKGYGLAIVIEIISGLLFGGSYGDCAKDSGQGPSFCFCAIDVDAFSDKAAFASAMDARIDEIKACPPAKGSAGVFLPGEMEHSRFVAAQERVDMEPAIIAELNHLAESVGLDQRL